MRLDCSEQHILFGIHFLKIVLMFRK